MAFPLAQRELGRLARSRHIHATRGLLIAAIAALLLAEYIPSLGVRRSVISPEYFGTLIHMACLAVQATVLLVVLPMLTAPLIASERSGSTLSLLLLADFRGRDILLAKSLSVLLEAGFLLLALMPIQFMSTIFGGVAPDMLAAQSLAAFTLALFTIMLSMLASCLVRNTTGAVFLAFALNGTVLTLLYLVDLGLKNTLGFLALGDLFIEFDLPVNRAFFRALIILAVLTTACAAAILALIPRLAIDRPRRYVVGAPTPYGHTSRRMLRWGPVLPILSVHATGLTSSLRTPTVRATVATFLTIVGCVPAVGTIVVVMLLIHEITASLIAARRSGALDDLRVTLISPDTLARDLVSFYWRRGLIYVPALMVCALQLGYFADRVVLSAGVPVRNWDETSATVLVVYTMGFVSGVILLGLAQCFAIVHVAIYAALYGMNTRRQSVVAIAVVGLAYALCVCGIQCQDYFVKFERIGDLWFRVPLVLTVCAGIFGLLGLVMRKELRAFLQGGWRAQPIRLQWPARLHPRASTR